MDQEVDLLHARARVRERIRQLLGELIDAGFTPAQLRSAYRDGGFCGLAELRYDRERDEARNDQAIASFMAPSGQQPGHDHPSRG